MNTFSIQRRQVINNAKTSLKSITYWENIDNKIKRMAKQKPIRFKMEFKHSSDIFSRFQPDDEGKIEAFADKYGYRIINEQLGTNKSLYEFERKST